MSSNETKKVETEETPPSEPGAPKAGRKKAANGPPASEEAKVEKVRKRAANGPLVSEEAKAKLDPWMLKWMDVAEKAKTIDEACEESKTTMSEYIHGRMSNTTFDFACLLFDQIVELRIINKIRFDSEEGDARAQGMYFKEVSRPAFKMGFPSWNAPPPPPPTEVPLPAKVAAAMIAAGLAAYEEDLPRPDDVKR